MNSRSPFRRFLSVALGLFLLQAFLAPGDLACALRHHGKTDPSAAMAGHGGHGGDVSHAGHMLAQAPAGGSGQAPADHCADPSAGHCDWMSACASAALMTAAEAPARAPAPQHAMPVIGAEPVLAGISLAPEVPPPRG